MSQENRIEELRKAVVSLDPESAEKICRTILDEGIDPQIALTEGAIKGLQEVGSLYENETYALPELMMSVMVMETVKDLLEPELIKMNKNVEQKGTILMGTVLHDIHDIGKKIVIAMLRGVGFEVTDIGNNISAETFVKKTKELKPDIVGMSALLTTTFPYAETIVKEMRSADVETKLILGGAPVTKEFADKIGVHYAENAGEASRLCSELLAEEAS